MTLQGEKPFVLCVDVGGPTRIGWADIDGRDGTGNDLGEALDRLALLLAAGRRVALGFEAPIWTPTRVDLGRITGRRGGVETAHNRAWSAGAGSGALGAALALMPWCLARIVRGAGPVAATVNLELFLERGGLFLWEAFVSGAMKVVGTTHHDDAKLACKAFVDRWPDLLSDIPPEPAVNHAVSCALAAGLTIDQSELVMPALVVAVAAKTGAELNRSRRFAGPIVGGNEIRKFHCPIADCGKVYINSRGGWDSHVGLVRNHPQWCPELTSAEERKGKFKIEFPDFFK